MIGVRHPLWRKAPTRLIRHPSLLAALGVGAMLVVIVATAYPLFLSASDSNLLASAMARPAITRFGAGLAYRSTDIPLDAEAPDGGSLLRERQDAFVRAGARSPNFGPVVESLLAPELHVSVQGGTGPIRSAPGRLFAGTDVLDHVQILAGTDGDGVWLTDDAAEDLQARPGDTVVLDGGEGPVEVAVDGIYAAPSDQSPDGYWQIWQDQIRVRCPDCSAPPQFILADATQLIDLQTRLRRTSVDQAFVAPARESPPLTLDDLRALRTTVDQLADEMQAQVSSFGLLFPCCGQQFTPGVGSVTSITSQTSGLVRTVEGRSVGLRGPAVVLLLAGLAIAFVVVSAAGVFSFSSRPVEWAVLSARGWGPLRVAAKAALESVLPVVSGALAGFAIAYVLVLSIGPDGPIEPTARATAMAAAVAAALAVLTVVASASALMFTTHHEHKERLGRVLFWMPWELFAFAALIGLGRSLNAGATLVGADGIPRPGAPVFLYPIAFAAAVGILVARVVAIAIVVRARRGGDARISAGWLAIRRVASSVRLAAVFLIAAAIAVSVSVSAQALVSSLRTTVTAKAKIFVGSDVQAQVVRDAAVPTDFPFPLTKIERALDGGHFDDLPSSKFELLVIDPSTFAAAAFWMNAFADVPLDELVARLDSGGNGSLPVVIANGSAVAPSSITVGVERVPVDVVGRAVSFPGSSSLRPVVVVGREAAVGAFPAALNLLRIGGATTEFWVRGPTDAVLDALARSDLSVDSVLTADQVRDLPFIVAAVNTFLTLDVLGVMALLLVVVLAVGYLHVRQGPRVVATGLSSRMGVSSTLLRRALILELGGVLLGALAIGVPTGLVASAVVLRSMDPLAVIPPRPIFVPPWIGVIAAAAFLLAAAVAGGRIVHRATRRADLGEVMRVAG